jgi:hypothetical protein
VSWEGIAAQRPMLKLADGLRPLEVGRRSSEDAEGYATRTNEKQRSWRVHRNLPQSHSPLISANRRWWLETEGAALLEECKSNRVKLYCCKSCDAEGYWLVCVRLYCKAHCEPNDLRHCFDWIVGVKLYCLPTRER